MLLDVLPSSRSWFHLSTQKNDSLFFKNKGQTFPSFLQCPTQICWPPWSCKPLLRQKQKRLLLLPRSFETASWAAKLLHCSHQEQNLGPEQWQCRHTLLWKGQGGRSHFHHFVTCRFCCSNIRSFSVIRIQMKDCLLNSTHYTNIRE